MRAANAVANGAQRAAATRLGDLCRAGVGLTMVAGFVASAWAGPFFVTNLVTDDQAFNQAVITDPNLVNAWGVSRSGGSPFWVSNNGTGTATLYTVNPTTDTPTKVGLTVTIPPVNSGNPTGQAFNAGAATGNFNGDLFLFVSEDGTISGWRNALGTTAEVLQLGSDSNVYKGVALALIGNNAYLYAANFRTGNIDVLKGTTAAPDLAVKFTDPNLPAGYAPFNIADLDNQLYVAYALQDATKHDEVPGPGLGIVDVYDLQGNRSKRLISTAGALDAPWGLALAPSSWPLFAGDLLVGNFGNGLINAYDPSSGAFLGGLLGPDGLPIEIDGLWALITGNGGNGGSPNKVYFSAGPQDESHGVFGLLAVPEPATLVLFGIGLTALAFARARGLPS